MSLESTTASAKKPFNLCRESTLLPLDDMEINGEDLSFRIHERIDDVRDIWPHVSSKEHFSSVAYLRTLENDSPDHLSNLYVIIFDKAGTPAGSMLLQSLTLEFSRSFSYDNYTTDRSLLSRIVQRIRQFVVSLFTFRMMTVGNLYLTGQYGFHFLNPQYSADDHFRIVNKTLKILKKRLCNTPYRFQGVLYKDFFRNQRPKQTSKLGLTLFEPDPNMILNLRPSWTSFDDYLLDMKSKYRVRLKSALKRFDGLQKKSMNLEDIRQHYHRMFTLYDRVLTGSGFVLAKGEKNYFLTLKQELGDNLKIVGYFLGDELIAFYTWVHDPDKIDSHFIGLEPELNHKYQLYLNILLDLVKDAISVKASRIYYFRTALEIKSSVGAEPYDMCCYFRHNNSLVNRTIIPFAFKYFVPHQSWDQRHPFKTVISPAG